MTATNDSKLLAFAEVSLSQLSPELRLLLACLRQALHKTAVFQNHQPELTSINWHTFLTLVYQHRLAPIIYPISSQLVDQGLPLQIHEKLRERYLGNTRRGLALSAELIRLSQAFSQNGITLFPLKGPVLAMQLYGDLSRRHAGDLDFLVESHQVANALSILQDLEYQPDLPDIWPSPGLLSHLKVLRYHLTFFHPLRKIYTELHWRLLNDPYEMRENDTRWFGSTLSYQKIGTHSLPCMPADRLLLYLCVHGSSHFWEKLFWLYDVALFFVRYQQNLDWTLLSRQAEELGCLKSLLLAAALSHVLLDVPVPENLQNQWESNNTLLPLFRLSYPFFNHSLSYPKNYVQKIHLTLYSARLRDSLARAIPYFVQKFFLPGFELSSVPVILFPIYFFLKPFLWIKSQSVRSQLQSAPDA